MTESLALRDLPTWDLADLYPGMDSAELKADMETADKAARAFARRHEGKLATLAGDELGQAIEEYERLQDVLGRIMSYAYLVYAGDVTDPKIGQFFQTMQERTTEITTHVLFFTLELNRLYDAVLNEKLAAPRAARYRPWLRDIRVFRPYQLSDELEKLLHEKAIAGRNAWVRLFDETLADLKFELDGESLSVEQVLHRLSDRDQAKRRAAGKALGQVFAGNARLFALVMNTLVKDKEIEDKWRKLPDPAMARHLSNQVEPEVVEALVSAVKNKFPRLSHRYYALKARWMGQDKLDYWDRNAPLPDDDDRLFAWPEAQKLVLDAYSGFSRELGQIGRRFFENRWIDAPSRPGKATGAFAHPTVPSAHPYLLLNYQGKSRDVMTLAHELGHGVHQVLSAGQGALMADTPLTLAETASVFGEQLTFRALLAGETDKRRRRALLASKVEDMLNTVIRQIAFYNFERRIHDERRQGELTLDRVCEHWLAVQAESLGPAVRFDEEYRYFWVYISHFIHSPFYVYAYAFGDCLVNALYAVYEKNPEGFADKYLAMLSAGGTLRHKELLAPFGLDASDPDFWSQGLGVIERFIDELEASE